MQTSKTLPTRILLVEDHGDTAEAMLRLLMAEGHEVAIAGNVATALEMLSANPYDLLISDIGLPDGNGIDLMYEIRRRGFTMPAIAHSAYGQEQDIRRSREAGFLTHLIKPASIGQLTEVINSSIKANAR